MIVVLVLLGCHEANGCFLSLINGNMHLCTPPKTNMTMENPPFEDVFPIEHGDFECHVSFQGVYPSRIPESRESSFKFGLLELPNSIINFPTQMKRRVRGQGLRIFSNWTP